MTNPLKESFKPIKGYEGLYEISNFGRLRSLDRKFSPGINCLKYSLSNGYYHTYICVNKNMRKAYPHQLVWDHFGNGKRNGRVLQIDHIDNDKLNNKINNLQVITQRANVSKYFSEQVETSSKYTGVCWSKAADKWIAYIKIKGILEYLGCFNDEYQAHLAYQKALKGINNGKIK